MQMVDLNKPGEKKKLLWAGLLGFGAILILWWALFGFGNSTPRPKPTASASPTPRNTQSTQRPTAPAPDVQSLTTIAPVDYVPSSYSAPEARRNIFAFYEPPPPKAVVAAATPTPTPTPPPPILLASVSPSNVYARTSDFKLEVAGDKFTSAMRIFVDGRELPTTYKSPQQLSTTISASFIAAPGTRSNS